MGRIAASIGRSRNYKQLRKFCSSAKRDAASFPGCSFSPTPYKGDCYDTVVKSRETCVTPGQKTFYKKPLLLHQGRAQWLWDQEGRRYLDMFGGIATVSVGHCHPKVVTAMSEQSYKLGHTTAIYLHPRYHEYVAKLTATMPEGLNCVYLTNSGSEATELALLLARLYTGRHEIISLKNCYHGGTGVAAAATAMACYRYPIPQPAGHVHVTNPDVYRGLWGGSNCRDSPVQPSNRKCDCAAGKCEAGDNYIKDFKDTFKSSVPMDGKVAAFTAESIQGVGGTVQYPRNYLPRVYEHVRSLGGLLIADEVQTGFGRTGTDFWGFQGHGVVPDIVVMAKGIGNGYPLGAVCTRPDIGRALGKAQYFNTYGGNPIACAVGSAVLDVIDEENLQENSHIVGAHLIRNLVTLMKEFPDVVGDVRGKGLMLGIELVANPDTCEPLPVDDVMHIFEDVKDSGVLIGKGGVNGNVFRIKPPMCVTKEDADYTVEALRTALKKHQASRK